MYDKNKNVEGKTKDILESVRGLNFKEHFGCIPKSIMKFKKEPKLMELIDWDNSELGKVEGDARKRGGGYASKLRYSIYNPSQAYFILDYYTRENDLILDPFMGRATRPLVSQLLKRRYIGFDTSSKTIELNTKLLKEKFSEQSWELYNSSGTSLRPFESNSEYFDAVFTCPPYYDVEKYSGEAGDLSHLSYDDFNNEIKLMFKNLYRLIKTSSYKEMKFFPVIFTVGSVRRGNKGIIDMDYVFQMYAKDAGFVLYDKLFTENVTPGAGFTFRRNYAYRFLTKNYETTLVFMKF